MKLAGRVAVVTGAGSGIGRAIAELFAQEGARVAALDQDREAMRSLESGVAAAGSTVRGFCAGVADEEAVERTVAAIVADWTGIDVLVTSAAISVGGMVSATPAEVWDRVFRVNVRGTYLWVKAVIPHMIARRRGSIITVGSQLAVAGGRGNVSYIERGGDRPDPDHRPRSRGRRDPGQRADPRRHPDPDAGAVVRPPGRCRGGARARSRHPMGRFGTAREVALGALSLASDDSSFTTGTTLVIDGGWLAG